jgi:ParB-like chromosome segregation protein Spo0J
VSHSIALCVILWQRFIQLLTLIELESKDGLNDILTLLVERTLVNNALLNQLLDKLRLLALNEDEQQLIEKEGLSERHARALLRLRDHDERLRVLEKVCRAKLTVRETEALVDLAYNGCAPKLIGGADRAEGVDLFLRTLKSSVNTLSSLGIEAKESVSYYGRQLYITVTINE